MIRLAAVPVLAITIGAGIACSDEAIRHPVPEALPDPTGPALVDDTLPPPALDAEGAARWVAARRAILDARPGAVIGVLEGGGPSMLGSVTDAMIDEGSQIYVLDRINSAVTVFDSTGAIVATFGGDGDGPLEFRLPVAFDLLEDGTLVIEELGGALKTFSRSEAGFDFRARIPIGSFARDMCALDNRVFAESGYPSYEGLLAEYAPEDAGEPLRSFGEGYAYGTELLRMQMNHGSLACLPGPGRVAFGFRAMPRVDLYSAAGKLLWTAGITDYVQGWTVETPQQDAGAAVSTPDFPKEWLVGLRPVAGDHIVAVYRRQMSAMSDREFRTYLIDSATGWGALVGDLLEPVAAIGGSIYVTVPSGPFPRLRVWRMREESTG